MATQTVPAIAVLGPGKTGLTIGLRVLNLDGTEYSAFSTTGVAETSTAGTYRKAGGVVAPDAGGYIVWGTELLDLAEATAPPIIVGIGAGAGYYSETLESPSGTPVDGARVMLATDEDGENIVYEAFTNALGVFEMRPDPGTYFRFIEAGGHTFMQGISVEVEAL